MPVQRAVAGIDAVAPFHQRLDALLQDAQEAVGAAARLRPALRVRVARRTAGRVRARGRRRVVPIPTTTACSDCPGGKADAVRVRLSNTALPSSM
ncbi:hypothetical protein G6F58_013288 [Rhizopus delemar]|nr:hypothetical protein G6F58_013288 [Rhizopus delemar]